MGAQTEEGWIKKNRNKTTERKDFTEIKQFNRNKEPIKVREMLKEVDCLEKDQQNLHRKTNNSKQLITSDPIV